MSTYANYNDLTNLTSIYTLALCQDGDIQLTRGSYSNVGRIDLCVRGTWATICSKSFDSKDASVVCRQLGYSPYGKSLQFFVFLNNLI